MKKMIGLLILAGIAGFGYLLYNYWVQVKEGKAEEVVVEEVNPDQLEGLPYQLFDSYHKVRSQGARELGQWLSVYGNALSDPRKAWIELDYVVKLAAHDPAKARKLFAEVKARTPTTSPVYGRIQRLAKTYETE